ncbi:S66 peptidase family protein [Penaeicola halotolerans]|uniref:S66 peptidase family protein n=1 Tax=Penaeicola halotolerans TaxID=2793196 RepID=UPI001CF8B360|nr:LD-carboxypeptidase [Penaeicola halotolerans]
MIRPQKLALGDNVAIVATGKRVDKDKIQAAKLMLESWGLKVSLGEHLFMSEAYLAASDAQRLSDLQQALDDPSIKAIFLARGGYGTTRILDLVDFTTFCRSPKWLIGFSDITALLTHIAHLGIQSIHGPMPQLFDGHTDHIDLERLRDLLFAFSSKAIYGTQNPHQVAGEVSAPIIGGNLSMLVHLIGTSSITRFDDKILVLEECNEAYYQIDRMLVQLKRAGYLAKIKGVAIGDFSGLTGDDFDYTLEEIFKMHLGEHVPMGFGFGFGHLSSNAPLVIGANYRLCISENEVSLSLEG